jgi:fucose permease
MAIVEKPFRALYATLFSVFVLFGTSMTIIGATLPRILSDFGWDYATAGAVIAAGAVGYFAATFAAGYLVARFGARATILAGLVLEVSGLMFFAATPSVPMNLALNLAIGIGQGFIELTVNWATLRMDRSGSGRAMNLMHGAFAAGAFAGPFAIGLLLGADLPWTHIYRGISVLFVFVAGTVAFLPFTALGRESDEPKKGKKVSLVAQPAYWLGFVALLLYVGVELGVSNWIAEYFVSVFGAAASTGSFMVSLFWGGLLFGRFGFPLFFRDARRNLLLLSMTVLMAFSVLALAAFSLLEAGPFVVPFAAAATFLAGLGCSIVYPIVVTLVGGIFHENQSEAIAFSAMGGGIGAFVFPYIMANVSAAWGLGAGFAIYAFFSITVVVSCFGLVRAGRKAAMSVR